MLDKVLAPAPTEGGNLCLSDVWRFYKTVGSYKEGLGRLFGRVEGVDGAGFGARRVCARLVCVWNLHPFINCYVLVFIPCDRLSPHPAVILVPSLISICTGCWPTSFKDTSYPKVPPSSPFLTVATYSNSSWNRTVSLWCILRWFYLQAPALVRFHVMGVPRYGCAFLFSLIKGRSTI